MIFTRNISATNIVLCTMDSPTLRISRSKCAQRVCKEVSDELSLLIEKGMIERT
jgi:hypothetical protein